MRGTAAPRPPSSSRPASSSDHCLPGLHAEGLPNMAEILVLAEHDGETVKKVTTELLTLARAHGEPAVVWTGEGAEGGRARLAEFGAVKGYVADSADYADYVGAPAAVLVAATSEGREVAGRLAVKTGSGILTDVTGLGDGLTGEQSIFGGAITVQSRV